ncbi:hypothetical protein Dimus_034294 [Dionaea muscipula]
MAYEQNLIPKDLRPLNTTITSAEETRIAPVSTSGRPQDGFYPDAGFGGLGFGNPSASLGLAPTVPVWGPRIPIPIQTHVVSPSGYVCTQNLGPRVGGNGNDQVSDYPSEDSVSGKKVKFLCSFAGKILPRPSDGMLRYVGGQTRIVGVKRDVKFSELAQKMADIYGQPVVIKYQLPDEDLDALVSVSCPDDLENMMDEYEKLAERSPDGSAKLRVFLFSASEIDSSGDIDFGDLQDGGQRYVEAVNGIMEGVGGGMTRKESIASVASTQNSDMSGAEAADTFLLTADNVPPPANTVSSKSDNPNPNNDVARLVFADANTVYHADSHTASLPVLVEKSGPLTISLQPEIVHDRPVTLPAQQEVLNSAVHADLHIAPLPVPIAKPGPLTVSSQQENILDTLPAQQQQLGHDPQQAGGRFPPPSAYFGYVDPHQDPLNHTDYQKLHPQVVYANPQVVAALRPRLIQPQYHDTTSTFVPQPFIPAVQITMTPSSSHLSMNPNMMQPLPQQRVITVPADQSYTSYQAQVPPAGVGGSYGRHQVPSQEYVALSEGWIPHQQMMLSDKLPRVGDCYMCQKQLPHAHSDTIVQEQIDSGLTKVGANPVYHSVHLDDMTGILPGSKIIAGGTFGDGTLEQVAGTGARVLGKMNYEGGMPLAETSGMPQSLEAPPEIDRFVPKRGDDSDLVKMLAPQSVMGLPDVQAPYGLVKGNIPQPLSEEATQLHLIPPLSQVKQEVSMNKPVNAAVGSASFKKPELLDIETANDYTQIIPGVALREDAAGSTMAYDHMRAIDGIEQLHISPPEVLSSSEQNKSPVDQSRKDDILDHKSQHILGREAVPNDVIYKPMVPETNQTKPSEVMSHSAAEIPHLHNGRPLESYEVSQIPVFRRDDPTTYQQVVPRIGLDDLATSSAVHSSTAQSNWTANILDSANSLFNNQDPCNLHHDFHFLPKPNKIVTRKEISGTRDPYLENRPGNGAVANIEVHLLDVINFPSANVNRDYISDQAQAGKVSSEELIKQELQATAEGVAASVLQSSIPPIPDSSSHERTIFVVDSSHEREPQNNSDHAAIQTKLEGMNIKPEKTNLGFPLSDGLGRLQIIKKSDLEELQELGSGTFGTVYHGKWRGTDVAIKRINDRCFAGKPSEQERMRDDFWNEAIKLADLHHPNVVAFYGVVLDGPGGSVATVTEYMVNGSLRTALQKGERNLDKRKRLLIAMDVAFGMEYLHSKNIVHFDLKSDNLLVNLRDPHRPICKVGDLGLSKVKCQTLISGGVRGTLPWMAPELLNGSSSLVSEKVDVFSFGIVMWELLTGEEPYADLHYGAIIGGIVSNTLRPPVPEKCDPDWGSLMERCWSAEPSERPSFPQIANELRAMASKLPPKGQAPTTNTRMNA